MNTQTKTQTKTNHAEQNQDKAGHYEASVIKSNIDYFVHVHGMTRDEAKEKVNIMVMQGVKLLTTVECNQAIVKAKEQARAAERKGTGRDQGKNKKAEDKKAEKAEQERKEHEEREKAEQEQKVEAEKAEKAEKDKVKPEHAQFVQDMIAKNNSIVQIKGYLLYSGYTAKQIKAHLDSLDLSLAKKRVERDTFNTRLYNRLFEGPMTEKELDAMIGDDRNAIKNKGSHMRKVNLANRLHEKYSAQ